LSYYIVVRIVLPLILLFFLWSKTYVPRLGAQIKKEMPFGKWVSYAHIEDKFPVGETNITEAMDHLYLKGLIDMRCEASGHSGDKCFDDDIVDCQFRKKYDKSKRKKKRKFNLPEWISQPALT